MTVLLVPIEGDGLSMETAFRPKYIRAYGVASTNIAYSGVALVKADLSPSQEAEVAANADVTIVPPLDNTVAVAATQAALESYGIPAQWVTAGMTYREVVRVIAGMFQLMQRTKGRGGFVALAGNLDKTLSQLSANVRTRLIAASDDLGLDRSAVSGTTTVREALRIAGQQFTGIQSVFG